MSPSLLVHELGHLLPYALADRECRLSVRTRTDTGARADFSIDNDQMLVIGSAVAIGAGHAAWLTYNGHDALAVFNDPKRSTLQRIGMGNVHASDDDRAAASRLSEPSLVKAAGLGFTLGLRLAGDYSTSLEALALRLADGPEDLLLDGAALAALIAGDFTRVQWGSAGIWRATGEVVSNTRPDAAGLNAIIRSMQDA
jgi:hypothetical protein